MCSTFRLNVWTNTAKFYSRWGQLQRQNKNHDSKTLAPCKIFTMEKVNIIYYIYFIIFNFPIYHHTHPPSYTSAVIHMMCVRSHSGKILASSRSISMALTTAKDECSHGFRGLILDNSNFAEKVKTKFVPWNICSTRGYLPVFEYPGKWALSWKGSAGLMGLTNILNLPRNLSFGIYEKLRLNCINSITYPIHPPLFIPISHYR